jgi:hypothetical protein
MLPDFDPQIKTDFLARMFLAGARNTFFNSFVAARTRDLCGDRKAEVRNSLKPGTTDGSVERGGTPWEPIISPLSHRDPLSS